MQRKSWLDRRVLRFRQTCRQFFQSKTNQVAITTLIGAGAGYCTSDMSLMQSLQLGLPAVFAMVIRDALPAAGGEK